MDSLPLGLHSAPSEEVGGLPETYLSCPCTHYTVSQSGLIWSGRVGGSGHLNKLVVAAHLPVTVDPVAVGLEEVRLVLLLPHITWHGRCCSGLHLDKRELSFSKIEDRCVLIGCLVCRPIKLFVPRLYQRTSWENNHLDCSLVIVVHGGGDHVGTALWLRGHLPLLLLRVLPRPRRRAEGRSGGAEDGEVSRLLRVQGRGGVKKGVLRGEEWGGSELRAAHDVRLQLLQLLQVSGLESRVEEGGGGCTWEQTC